MLDGFWKPNRGNVTTLGTSNATALAMSTAVVIPPVAGDKIAIIMDNHGNLRVFDGTDFYMQDGDKIIEVEVKNIKTVTLTLAE